MSSFILNRRSFGLGLTASLAMVPSARAFAQDGEARTVTTWLGTYDIPADPRRIIVIDGRIDLETALILNLPILAYCHWDIQPWVPVDAALGRIASPPNMEEVLGLEPDLFLCSDWGDLESWPITRLRQVAPVLPLDARLDWRENLANIAGWLDVEGRASEVIAEYEAVTAAVAQKHAALLDTAKVALLYYFPNEDQIFIRGYDSAQERVLRDIGGHTIDPAMFAGGLVSMENAPEILSDVDAIIYSDFSGTDAYQLFQEHALWDRIPAAAAGRVHHSTGNLNFGGGYTAMQIAREWDAAYSLLA